MQTRAVLMSTNQVEEAPKAEIPFSTYVKDKFIELSNELAGGPDMLDSVNSGEGLARGSPEWMHTE